MRAKDQKQRYVTLDTSYTSGNSVVTAANPFYDTGTTPYSEIVTPFRTALKINPFNMTVDVSAGGANDGRGEKLFTFPEGFIDIQRVMLSLTVTPAAGVSGASAVIALGTAQATADNQALTSTEADILASTTLGDGTLVAATAETVSAAGEGVAGVLDGSATAKDAWLNIAGTFTKATGSTSTLAVAGTVIVDWVYLGDD